MLGAWGDVMEGTSWSLCSLWSYLWVSPFAWSLRPWQTWTSLTRLGGEESLKALGVFERLCVSCAGSQTKSQAFAKEGVDLCSEELVRISVNQHFRERSLAITPTCLYVWASQRSRCIVHNMAQWRSLFGWFALRKAEALCTHLIGHSNPWCVSALEA